MTIPNFRSNEALYTVTFRDPQARKHLITWAAGANRGSQARVEENRMYIYDQTTLSTFMVTWTHGWNLVNIWDNWAKRHVIL
jgi:hypothetical protein